MAVYIYARYIRTMAKCTFPRRARVELSMQRREHLFYLASMSRQEEWRFARRTQKCEVENVLLLVSRREMVPEKLAERK